MTKKIIGIIISKNKYLEHDEILNVMTSDALISILAKGVMKLESKNRSNISLCSLVEFEILIKYSSESFFLLKKATLLSSLPPINKLNSHKIETIIRIFKKIRDHNKDIFDICSSIVSDFEGVNFFKNQSYLISMILDINGEGLSFSSCVLCGTNQDLHSFDVYQGGILCKNHSKSKTPILLLKSFYHLGQSLDHYISITSPETNKQIFNILSRLLF
ncbi:MAG: recombination protein O N-terminal domain-containing protein [Mycoplasmataceae bacterium]|nr:recombination protein O N-terminal domain-containing protein [Mycoplasmataceae bacterium]